MNVIFFLLFNACSKKCIRNIFIISYIEYRVSRKVLERAMRKKGIADVLVRSVTSLYEGAKTRARVDSELPEELKVNVGMHQGSVLSPFILPLVEDVVNEIAREGALSELLCADDLFLMSETIMGLSNKFPKWKEAFESKVWMCSYCDCQNRMWVG